MKTEFLFDILKSLGQTFQMLGISLILSILLGIPLGLFLFLTSDSLFSKNKILNFLAGLFINIIRSTPFVILLVLLLPLTQLLTGTTIGPRAATVPLSFAAIAFYARLVEAAFRDLDRGIIEAALSTGASTHTIIYHVLLTEALPSLIVGITVTAISLIGYSAMAGIIGGGGIGDLAIRFGYYRYQTQVMIITVIILVLIVQGLQGLGDYGARIVDKK